MNCTVNNYKNAYCSSENNMIKSADTVFKGHVTKRLERSIKTACCRELEFIDYTGKGAKDKAVKIKKEWQNALKMMKTYAKKYLSRDTVIDLYEFEEYIPMKQNRGLALLTKMCKSMQITNKAFEISQQYKDPKNGIIDKYLQSYTLDSFWHGNLTNIEDKDFMPNAETFKNVVDEMTKVKYDPTFLMVSKKGWVRRSSEDIKKSVREMQKWSKDEESKDILQRKTEELKEILNERLRRR